MAKVDSSPRQRNPGDSKMALALLPVFVMSEHSEKPADLMQTDRCCWGWWRIHCQQHYSVFPLLYPSYSWQMQRHQFSTNFPIFPPSSFPFRCQKLLNLSSSLPYSHPFPQCTVQVCLYCKKSWMGSVVNSTNNVAGRGHVQHSADTVWQPPSLSVWWPGPARKNS